MFTYEEAEAYIAEIPKFTKKNEPGNTRELMRRLGNPQDHFTVIHVAGTNGKGSVCAFLESMLRMGGKRTGLFISPHLIKLNERFQVDRIMMEDADLAAVFTQVKGVIDSMVTDGFFHPTYFEILFAMGMVWFEKQGIDVCVLETGLGGRLDATNVVEHPAACVITSISLDHTEYLGDTVTKIAGEKAGIIKEGVPVIFDASDREAARVITEKAAVMHARAVPVYPPMAQITRYDADGITYVLNNTCYDYREVRVPFPADYQVMNSMLALTALRILDPLRMISDAEAIRGILRTRWSGRMEPVLPGVVLDGAHNADGIAQFLKTVERISRDHPVSLLFAAVVEKDYEEMIREICERVHFTSIVVTQIEGSRKVDAERFAEIFARYTDVPVKAVSAVPDAFRLALELREENGVLFCAGSLYMIGEIEAALCDFGTE